MKGAIYLFLLTTCIVSIHSLSALIPKKKVYYPEENRVEVVQNTNQQLYNNSQKRALDKMYQEKALQQKRLEQLRQDKVNYQKRLDNKRWDERFYERNR